MKRVTMLLLLAWASAAAAGGAPQSEVTVRGDVRTGKSPSIGLLHGVTFDPRQDYTETVERLSALRPKFWRLNNMDNNVEGFVSAGEFVEKFGTKLVFNVQIAVHKKFGFDLQVGGCASRRAGCFADFTAFQTAWAGVVTALADRLAYRRTPAQYFEVFAEPAAGGFNREQTGTTLVGVTPSQLLELYKTTHDVLRQKFPAAKIGGPGWVSYDDQVMEGFLDYAVDQGLALDFLSWHEFGAPEDVPAHAAQARRLIAARPSLCAPACPEIHVGEFSPAEHNHVPAMALGWFYHLEAARVDASSRACWNVADPEGDWASCWAGFDGLLLRDNVTPSSLYWVYKWYAETGRTRLRAQGSRPGTVAFAQRDDARRAVEVLVGRYGDDGLAGPLAVNVTRFPYRARRVKVSAERLPNLGRIYRVLPLLSPQTLPGWTVPVQSGTVRISLPEFADGEVYRLTFTPAP